MPIATSGPSRPSSNSRLRSPHWRQQTEWDAGARQDFSRGDRRPRDRLPRAFGALAGSGTARRSRAFTAICISGRCWWRTVMSTSSTSRANRRNLLRTAGQEPSAARCCRHDPLVRLRGRGGEAEERREPGACCRSTAAMRSCEPSSSVRRSASSAVIMKSCPPQDERRSRICCGCS